ncbi:OprD family outer membrane porin [Pseudomonas sp. NPDC007930]|uniref:OprD family porin n=1 Tax=Pseudomonas sp. NPDC007930 TaxID=3364417 RepID=UPI0036E3C9E3
MAKPLPALLLAGLPLAAANAYGETEGFLEGSRWDLLNRVVEDRRDYRHGSRNSAARNAYKPRAARSDRAEEAAYGLMATFTSGFTPGPLGLGLDAHLYSGLMLDSGGGRAGKARLLAVDNSGQPQPEYSRAGAAAKLRLGGTEVRYGEQRVKTPVFSSSDSRLLPETATGWWLSNTSVPGLALNAGHFSASTDRNASGHNGAFVVNYASARQGSAYNLLGGRWVASPALTLSLYSGEYTDTWRQHYAGALYSLPLSATQALAFDANLYRTQSTGQARAGRIDNTAGSLLGSYSQGSHKLTLGYQKVRGDTPFDYVTRGAIWLGNAVALSDFNGPGEASWQLRYDLAMAAYGVPGLSLSAAYVRGRGIDGRGADPTGGYAYLGYGEGGRHWERDLEARYVVQRGPAKGLTLAARYAMHRGNSAQAELDADQLRLALEYPLKGAW